MLGLKEFQLQIKIISIHREIVLSFYLFISSFLSKIAHLFY